MTRTHEDTAALERVKYLLELWSDELGADRCPSCGGQPANYCDHGEGYHHACAELKRALRGPDPSYLVTPGGCPSERICGQWDRAEWGTSSGLLSFAFGSQCGYPAVAELPDGTYACESHVQRATRVHNHPPYEPPCNERRLISGQLRGACLKDDGSSR